MNIAIIGGIAYFAIVFIFLIIRRDQLEKRREYNKAGFVNAVCTFVVFALILYCLIFFSILGTIKIIERLKA